MGCAGLASGEKLLFKTWKSLLFLDKVGQMNIFRFECFLYGRLVFILLSTELMSFIKSAVKDREAEIEISEWKTMKLIKKNLPPPQSCPAGRRASRKGAESLHQGSGENLL